LEARFSALHSQWVGMFNCWIIIIVVVVIVYLLCFLFTSHTILGNVTFVVFVFYCLYSMVTMVTTFFTLGHKDLKALLALGTKDLWISFEPLGRFS
jgi:hypothetical protein